MYLISTSKKTVLSDFADLETKSEYVHSNGESTDFQFNAKRRVFVEVDKKAGLAVMRIKENQQNGPELQRLRKLTIDNAYSVCCAKTASNQIAIGQSSGFVKLFNYHSGEMIHRYPADQKRNTVLYVDYNCTDDYIAAVMEDGKINIYGTRTKQKMESISIDDYSTLARFHPSKRFHLAVASYKGAVSVYDVQSKRRIFDITEAHHAPCRDVAMCKTQPSLLVSVGYDCHINIFDIRRNKAQSFSSRLAYTHPLSTVALSECGTYFCAGNLKGELIAYDMRSTKTPLAVKAVHDGCAVSRVAFVPMLTEEQHSSSLSSSVNVTLEAATVNAPQQVNPPTSVVVTAPSAQPRDSFCDFLDTHRPRGLDRMSTRVVGMTPRDSFDWDALNQKRASEEQRQSICQTGSGLSSSDSSTTEPLQQTLSGPLRDRSNLSTDAKLKQIAETDEHEQTMNCSEDSAGDCSDKENPPVDYLEQKRRLRILSSSRNSTPRLGPPPPPLIPKTSSGVSSVASGAQCDIQKEINDLKEAFKKLELQLCWSDDVTHFQMYMQHVKFRDEQREVLKHINDGLSILLKKDAFTQEFTRLQYENKMLKAQLQELQTKQEDPKASK